MSKHEQNERDAGATSAHADDNHIIAERRAKLQALRDQGVAWPNDFRPDTTAQALQQRFAEHDNEQLEQLGERFAVAGRMLAKRVMGKASFVQLQDRSGRIQLFLQRDALGEQLYQDFKHWDVGDIIGASGEVFRTRTGELSLRCDQLRLLSKSLRPLPEKFHGLTDTETRYRQRYVDLIVNSEVRDTFITRARVISYIRDFMEAPGHDFLEVETPMMHPIPGGAVARPFITHHNALDCELYLRVAPELYLKRLVVGGLERVYEINRNFRNEGVSTRHNPEFTMLEFYWAYADFHDLMDFTEQMLRGLSQHVLGTTAIEYQGMAIDFAQPFQRLDLLDAVLQAIPQLTREQHRDPARLRRIADELDIRHAPEWGWGKLLLELFEAKIEHTLIQPTFITGYPAEVSPLSRASDADAGITDRFELFIAGREIANGFSELNDPEDQERRFRAQVSARDAGDSEAMHFDADYIRALEYGMPPTAGEGIGIDRLVMLLTNSASIRDVLLFPYLRQET
ncbi:MAG: lysine--tRNA ligase [Wenzhouxiangellaceae bacterium]